MAKQNKRQEKLEDSYKINDEIHLNGNVRIVGDGFNGDVMTMNEARKLSQKMELDLVAINFKADPPIIRLCNFSKFIYEQKKKLKENKNKPKPVKEVQLTPMIAQHDLETKLNMAKRFIEDGSRVRVVLTMRGRELARREENKKSLYEFLSMAQDFSTVESTPKDEGNKTSTFLKPRQHN